MYLQPSLAPKQRAICVLCAHACTNGAALSTRWRRKKVPLVEHGGSWQYLEILDDMGVRGEPSVRLYGRTRTDSGCSRYWRYVPECWVIVRVEDPRHEHGQVAVLP